MTPEPNSRDMVQTVVDNLGAVFRHLFPGVLVLGAARVAFPCSDWWINTYSWPNLAFTGVIALTVGNVWFTLNRYAFHQLADLVLYWIGCPGPSRKKPVLNIWMRFKYPENVADFVKKQFLNDDRSFAQHVTFRASAVLLMYTVAELGFLFSLWNQHCFCTPFSIHPHWVQGISGAILVAGFLQHGLTHSIDSKKVSPTEETGTPPVP